MVISIKKIVKSTELGCSDEILTASAMILCGKSIYVGKVGRKYGMQQYAVAEGDLITDINAFQAFLMARKSISWCKTKEMDYKALTDVIKIRKALERKLSQLGFKHSTCGRNPRSAIQCILTGFAGSVARLQRDGSFKALRGGAVIFVY